MNGLRLRPLSLGDIFDEGFDLYKRNFVFLLLVSIVAIVPLDIFFAWLSPRLLPAIFDQFGLTNADQFWLWFFTGLIGITVYLPFYIVGASPLFAAASARYLHRETTVAKVYLQSFRRLPGLLTLALVGSLAMDLGLLGCGIAWLAVAGQFLFALPAFLVEKKGPIKALGRSGALGSGYGGRTFICLFQLGLITGVISLGIRLPFEYLFSSVLNITPGLDSLYSSVPLRGQSAEEAVVALVSSGLAHLLLLPFLVSVVTVLYYDMRIRKEGFDVELLAEGLNYPPLAALGAFLPPAPAYGMRHPGYVPPHSAYRGGARR